MALNGLEELFIFLRLLKIKGRHHLELTII
jgi:hypothetical protein